VTLGAGVVLATGTSPITVSGFGQINVGAQEGFIHVPGSANLTVAVPIAGTGSLQGYSLVKTGDGTLTLSGLNTYTRATVVNGGTVSVGVLANGGQPSGIGQSIAASGNLFLLGGATLEYTGGTVTTDRGARIGSGGATVRVTNPNANLTFTGMLENGTVTNTEVGSGGLTKTGLGTLTLGGGTNYQGDTTVAAGALRVTGGTAVSSRVIVQNGASVGGTGTIGGAITVQPGGLLRGGTEASPTGTLTASLGFSLSEPYAVTLAGGSAGGGAKWGVDFGGTAGTANSKLSLTGAGVGVNFAGVGGGNTVTFTLLNDTALVAGTPYTITLATANGANAYDRNGADIGAGNLMVYGTDFTISSAAHPAFSDVSLAVVGSDLRLTFTPVPEPGSVLAIGAGVLAVGTGVRRWRRRG
jgi:fibronectin-binding autotransporter adhesin